MAKMIVVNIERCVGCHTCELSCAVAHSTSKDLMTIIREDEKPMQRLYVEALGSKPVPILCHHCEKAACMMVCPTGAIQRKDRTEPVVVDSTKCIGCKMCVQACPFGMIVLDPNGTGAIKCDLCIQRLEDNEQPACVTSCPTQTLDFVNDDEGSKTKRVNVAQMVLKAQEELQENPEGMLRYA